MNRNIILIALLGLLFVSKAVAQSVTVEAKIDSLQILIGEQAKVQLQVAMDAKQRAIFPAYTDTLVRGVEIIETVKPDTQFLNDRQRMVITQEYIITSFDSALYYLPPMRMGRLVWIDRLFIPGFTFAWPADLSDCSHT